jgi:hypothetical protein
MCEALGAPHRSRPPRLRPTRLRPTRLPARVLTCCDHRRAWRVPGESARSTRSDSAHTSDTVLTCALRSTPCRIRRSVQDSPKAVSTTWPQRRLRVASVAVRGVRGKLRAPGAERRWQRLQSRQRLQPVACVSQATMALEGVRAPNLGPMWAQRPRLAITERLHAIERLLHPPSPETHRPIPPIWGVKGSRVQISPARPNSPLHPT